MVGKGWESHRNWCRIYSYWLLPYGIVFGGIKLLCSYFHIQIYPFSETIFRWYVCAQSLVLLYIIKELPKVNQCADHRYKLSIRKLICDCRFPCRMNHKISIKGNNWGNWRCWTLPWERIALILEASLHSATVAWNVLNRASREAIAPSYLTWCWAKGPYAPTLGHAIGLMFVGSLVGSCVTNSNLDIQNRVVPSFE
jgi:hypothetical protein